MNKITELVKKGWHPIALWGAIVGIFTSLPQIEVIAAEANAIFTVSERTELMEIKQETMATRQEAIATKQEAIATTQQEIKQAVEDSRKEQKADMTRIYELLLERNQ